MFKHTFFLFHGINDFLLICHGIIVVRSAENISARLAGNIGKKLKIAASEAVLFRERFVYDAGDRPIEYNIGYYRSDKFIYSIDIKKA